MLDFTRFEIMTFDCYGTLINWEDGILGCLRNILKSHGMNVHDAAILELYGEFEAKAESGDYRRYRDVLKSVVTQFGERLQFIPSDEEVGSLAESLPQWKPWPDTKNALLELHKRFRLVIISNVDDDLFAGTRPQLGVEFDQVITAEQAGAYKPSLKIFEMVLGRIRVPAHRILHVGQCLYHDVVPAQSLGLSTVWVNRPSVRSGIGAVKAAEGNPDLQVSSLEELAAAALT